MPYATSCRPPFHGSSRICLWPELSVEYVCPETNRLLGHLEKLKVTVPKRNKPLHEAVNNAWVKLREYYDLTDNSHGIYAAASLFYPCLRLAHFKEHWTGEMVT